MIGYFQHELNTNTIRNVLIIGSGKDDEIQRVWGCLLERFPMVKDWRVIVPIECIDSIGNNDHRFCYSRKKGLWSNMIHKIHAVRYSRAIKSDLTVVLFTGYKQYNLMKLLAFISKTGKILAYNENMDSFYIDHGHRNILKNHQNWRKKENRITLNFIRIPLVSNLLSILLKVVRIVILMFMYIVFIERLRRLKLYVK